MPTLKIHNWDRWQSYRSDRGQPPWIKIHREVMRHVEWVSLTDAQRGQLVAIWLLGADHNGVIPASPSIIKKLCHLDSEPDLKLFMEHGFIDDGVIVASNVRQLVSPETETETETEEKRVEAECTHPSDAMSPSAKVDSVPYQKIIDLYHQKLPANPKVVMLTNKRKAAIGSRWRSGTMPDLETWGKYFDRVGESAFLTGKIEPNGDRKRFVADIDFLINENNIIKVAEGKYYGKS